MVYGVERSEVLDIEKLAGKIGFGWRARGCLIYRRWRFLGYFGASVIEE